MAAPPWYNPRCTCATCHTLPMQGSNLLYIEICGDRPILTSFIRIVFEPRQNIFPDWITFCKTFGEDELSTEKREFRCLRLDTFTFISWQWQFWRHCQSNHLFSVFTSSSKSVRRPGVFHHDSAKLFFITNFNFIIIIFDV